MNKLLFSFIFAAAIAGCNTDNRTSGDQDNRDTVVVIEKQAPAPVTTQTPQGKDSEVKIKIDPETGVDLEIKKDRND